MNEFTSDQGKPLEVVLVTAASLAFPIALYKINPDEYIALWMECTHKGCEVNAQPNYLVCPCHGSEYDAKGNVVEGPAETNLKTFNITTDHEYIYAIYKNLNPLLLLILMGIGASVMAQRVNNDTTAIQMNMDAVYNRPFLQAGSFPVALGGYIEAHAQYFVTDGITEGVSFKIPRITLFISSTIKERIKFLSEIEFEEGTKEINIEFAALDFELHPVLNLRGGIIMNPIGAFNQNHDGPKWEFVDRPIMATTIIPATFSNVGFGLHGKTHQKQWV